MNALWTRDNPHRTGVDVRGYELDSFGHANHAVFLNYFEHARWQAFREAFGQGARPQGADIGFVVRKLTVEYHMPALLFDALEVRTWIARTGNTSLTFGQAIARLEDGALVASAEVVAVCLGEDGRPRALPEVLRGAESF